MENVPSTRRRLFAYAAVAIIAAAITAAIAALLVNIFQRK